MLGFKPALVIIKKVGASTPFVFFDKKNKVGYTDIGHGPIDDVVGFGLDQSSGNSTSGMQVKFYSNGFKVTGTGANINTNGSKYIFMAWAHTTIGVGNGIPPTAL